MTRKHYEAIAGIIAANRVPCTSDNYDFCRGHYSAMCDISEKLADYFASNKKFNRDNFMKMCFGGE